MKPLRIILLLSIFVTAIKLGAPTIPKTTKKS